MQPSSVAYYPVSFQNRINHPILPKQPEQPCFPCHILRFEEAVAIELLASSGYTLADGYLQPNNGLPGVIG